MASADVIRQGQNVILKKGKSLRLYQVWRKRKVHLDKKHFCLDEAIGKPYGTSWDVRGHNVQLVTPDSEEEDTKEGGTDNRSLNDDKCSQKLRDEDIQELKNKGKHGEAIVEKLVENSTSFKEKTIYSQAKYLKRKRDKQLRIDTLAQILTSANIQSGINVIMMETCQGLLLGAIMERMAGKGIVVQIHSENVPVRLAIDAYNFPASYKETLYSYPLDRLDQLESTDSHDSTHLQQDGSVAECSGLQSDKDEEHKPINGLKSDEKDNLQSSGSTDMSVERSTETNQGDDILRITVKTESLPSGGEKDFNMADFDYVKDDACKVAMETDSKSGEMAVQGQKRKFQVNPEKEARKQRRIETLGRVRDVLQTTQMDALVMACRFQPFPIFTALFKYLALSRPFVVYCHYIEPLMECNDWLRNSGDAVNIRVTETWLREYQVLPERTHPQVNMSGTGGYLLTGTKVSNAS